jgi:Holliday junction resolvasome RuvABC endonuclease subunit
MTVWGVDVGLGVTTICAIQIEDDHEHVTFRMCEPPGPEAHEVARLMELQELLRTAAMGLPRPDLVVIERPQGKFPKALLMMAAGVICVTLRELTAVPTFLCAVQEWKKETVGKGNASKEEVMAWAAVEFPGADEWWSQDDADAYGLARFALTARREAA